MKFKEIAVLQLTTFVIPNNAESPDKFVSGMRVTEEEEGIRYSVDIQPNEWIGQAPEQIRGFFQWGGNFKQNLLLIAGTFSGEYPCWTIEPEGSRHLLAVLNEEIAPDGSIPVMLVFMGYQRACGRKEVSDGLKKNPSEFYKPR